MQSDRPVTRQRNRRGEGDKLRVDLVAAATRLLEHLPSPDALSLRAVAREAGVSTPSIYQHFPDKQTLMRAVMVEQFGLLSDQVRAAASEFTSPDARLRASIRGYADFAEQNRGVYRVLFCPAQPESGTDATELIGADTVNELVEPIAECIEGGLMPPQDPFQCAVFLWSTIHGSIMLRASKRLFPWPPMDETIDMALEAACGLTFEA